MIDPSISSLMEKVDSRYTLCILVGKRARQLADGARVLTNNSSKKAVTLASNEVNEDMITYVRTKSGIK
ncbi:UNVERIFIED_CONTAM: DNA-directed RNA polymerase subunit omega [Acetivibrio alkalicellulosi]